MNVVVKMFIKVLEFYILYNSLGYLYVVGVNLIRWFF